MTKYRFFFHYRKSTGGMTVHFRGKCIPCKDIRSLVGVETKYNPKQQPHLVMQGYCQEIEQVGDLVTIK